MADPIEGAATAWPAKAGGVLAARARGILAGAALAATLVAAGPAMCAPPAAASPQIAPAARTAPDAMSHSDAATFVAMSNRLDKTLAKVDATDDQKARIKTILITSLSSLAALKPQVEGAPGDLKRLLTAPTIDRVALERLRAQLMVDLDQASKTLVQGLADAADALTPEQRTKLAVTLAGHPTPHP
ncbi:MAG: Spy/CpxP family protein refolding chaperone [Caulobacteraceae bacterium]